MLNPTELITVGRSEVVRVIHTRMTKGAAFLMLLPNLKLAGGILGYYWAVCAGSPSFIFKPDFDMENLRHAHHSVRNAGEGLILVACIVSDQNYPKLLPPIDEIVHVGLPQQREGMMHRARWLAREPNLRDAKEVFLLGSSHQKCFRRYESCRREYPRPFIVTPNQVL